MPRIKKHEKSTRPRPRAVGWLTTDADEIERRRRRGLDESYRIEPVPAGGRFFGAYRVHADNERSYDVEIRSLVEPVNSCDCPDHRINGLGTCKHVEAVLHRLQHRRRRAFQEAATKGSPSVEVFQDRRDGKVRVRWPKAFRRGSKTFALLQPYFSADDTLAGEPLDSLPVLQRAVAGAPAAVRRRIRISSELGPWLEVLDRREQLHRSRQHFETEVATGNASLDLVRHTLYPYQLEGMLHLAFTGRALLADEMGLGKTVQAIAACELLRQRADVRRVLVIAPASLKGEWEEQINKFTGLTSQIIRGPRAERLLQYRQPAFFHLANYEQIRPDVTEINATLAPDVIILDEAQRIKNWQTRTASSVKRLQSPYAFVLTGTPLENRIDEIYSIAQFLDPHLFGPLFRFNREFYQLDDKGRAVGYRNLDRLHERLRPVMLRRRKDEVEGQLPGRTVNTYFVPMHREQTMRYEEYQARVARLAAMARSRPLRKADMERLQRNLACMRMLCDTPYILDQDCRISPKLKELDSILQELMADGEHKVIVFSEWERMLVLVRELADGMGLGYAWHTGKVPQKKRRGEIRRFKDDPQCRLFLSTDSGSVGLNLQAADVVINLDMPWNPAKLEQRIARAWRKHQTRPVQVINLVSEHTIEHRMLSLLEQKQALAAGVIDGKGSREMSLPSGRAAFLERLDALMTRETDKATASPAEPFERLRDGMLAQWPHQIELMELHGNGERQTLLVVAERPHGALQDTLSRQLQELFPAGAPQYKLLDQDAYATILELIEAGVLNAPQGAARPLHRASETDGRDRARQKKRLDTARRLLADGEYKQRMAQALAGGGFAAEALGPMHDAVEHALHALSWWQGFDDPAPLNSGLIDSALVRPGLLPADTPAVVAGLRGAHAEPDKQQASTLLTQGEALLARATSLLQGD